jgi:carbon storage regulator
MLVLSRKSGEQVYIAGNIEVTIISVQGGRVRLGFNAPPSVSIHRAEVQRRVDLVTNRSLTHDQIPQQQPHASDSVL